MRFRTRLILLCVTAAVFAVTCGSGAAATSTVPGGDWTTFDYNAQRSGVGPANTGISAANLQSLRRLTIHVDGTVDSSPVELHAVLIDGRVRDAIIVTTSYGRTEALDASTGARLWEYLPASVERLQGSPQITTATPIVDPDRQFIYAASPDGYIHKLRVSSGRQVWGTRITNDPTREKIAGALNISGSTLITETDGYNGDTPVYQGHVVTINMATGRITHVWNTLCSNIHALIDPPSKCRFSDSAIWGRPGAVLEPNGRMLVTTGNGDFNGRTDWGDSVLELSPSLQLLHNWTPANQQQLNAGDWDLGSTEPALLPVKGGLRLAVQGGKQGILYLLNLNRLDGTTGHAGPRTGGELQRISAPGGTDVFSEPAVWQEAGRTFVFVADGAGTGAYVLGADHRLHVAWQDSSPGTSPIVAGGLLYVYDENGGVLNVRNPVTGRLDTALPAARGHWNSPIVVGGRIILPEGNDNDFLTAGTIDIYHLPGY